MSQHEKGIFRFYGLFAFLGMILFGVCLVIGLINEKNYMIFLGLGIVLVDFLILLIIYSLYSFKEGEKTLKKKNKEIQTKNKEVVNLKNINNSKKHHNKQSAYKFYKVDDKKADSNLTSSINFSANRGTKFKNVSKRDKIKIFIIFFLLITTLLTFMAGIGLASFGTIGFILMGIGGGGFMLIILSFLLISKIKK